MQRVLQHILDRRRRLMGTPCFVHLADPSFAAEDRLVFLPALANIILCFGDLQRYVLPYAEPGSAIELAINARITGDAAHWPAYREDLRALGRAFSLPHTHSLRECGSIGTTTARLLTYTLLGLVADTTPIERIALIEVMDTISHAVFSALALLATALERERGLHLPFCSGHHRPPEADGRRALPQLALDDATSIRVSSRVDATYDALEQFLQTVHESVRRQVPRPPAPHPALRELHTQCNQS